MPAHDQLNARFSIGDLSKLTGVNIETIRYYERERIMPAPARTAGGHRVYTEAQARRLQFVKRSRELGFTLAEVRGLLNLVDGGDYTCGEVHEIVLRHLEDVRRKLHDLRIMEGVLDAMAAECAGGDVPECPVVDALYQPSTSARATLD